jgi:formylglycine-generating enzyme required for sulfatase activity
MAIVLATLGGSTWVYAAHINRTPFDEDGWRVPPRHAGVARDPEEEDGELGPGDGSDPAERQGRGGHRAPSNATAGEGATLPEAGASALQSGQRSLHHLAVLVGISADGKPDDGSIKSFKDCVNCPEMAHVAAGTAVIGAAYSDRDATRAEQPPHRVRIWPGFALSRTAVTSASYQAFLRDTQRTPGVCGEVLASNDQNTVWPRPDAAAYARCVTAGDAEAYASWLTARTGKRYRLPTAVEWEYAMRTIGAPDLSFGDVAEIVADCWQDRLPQPGREIIASQSGAFDCPARMLKGASTSDAAKWHRPSARRMLTHRARLAAVGFRVMREE